MIAYAKISFRDLQSMQNKDNKPVFAHKYMQFTGENEHDISNNVVYAGLKWGFTECELVSPQEYADATGEEVPAELLKQKTD